MLSEGSWNYNNVSKTRYSPLRGHAAVRFPTKLDWSVNDSPGWCSYYYRTADVHEVPGTHRYGRNCSASNPRAQDDDKLSSFTDMKATLDAREAWVRKSLTEALNTPFDKVSAVITSSTDDVSPMVESAAYGRESEEVSIVASGKGVGGKRNTVDGLLFRLMSVVEALLQKRKEICLDEVTVDGVPTDVDVERDVTNAESKSRSIAEDRSDFGNDAEAPVFARPAHRM